MQGCKMIPATAAAAASSAAVTSSLTSNHVVAGGRAAQRLQESGSQQQQQLLKVGLPMMASDSAKVFSANSARLQAMNRPCSSTQKKSSRQLVAVRATQIDTFIKGLQEKLHLPTHESETSEYVSVNGTLTVRKKSLLTYMDVGSDLIDDTEDALFDQKVLLQLVSSDVLDPSTNIGKVSKECPVKNWDKVEDSMKSGFVEYPVTLLVPKDFGTPGALVVRNKHRNEVFVKSLSVTLPDGKEVYFLCDSWVYNVNKYKCDRIFFSNQVYLPDKTPPGLVQLRETEKVNLRGDGLGERKPWDRIYDYAIYNDLGDPTKPGDARPNLGGNKELPYPRRCRTGRPVYDVDEDEPNFLNKLMTSREFWLDAADPSMEIRVNGKFYMPRDEVFDGQKETDFLTDELISYGHNLLPALECQLSGGKLEFKSFKDVRNLYQHGITVAEETVEKVVAARDQTQKLNPFDILKKLGADDRVDRLKYTLPQVIMFNEHGWMNDEEFGRQRLCGINPVHIELLRSFPVVSKLNDPEGRFGDPTSAITHSHIEPYLEGMSVAQALEAKRLYILDYNDLYLPYVKKINALESFDSQTYATRSIFFLNKKNLLKPCAIELALEDPSGRGRRVFTPPKNNEVDWMWELAKAHVRTNDSGLHQLYSHWLCTHAAMEPFIIATNRQLSALHPVHLLLLPHFKNTMNTNVAARMSLISANGIIEKSFTPGKYSVEILSSKVYGEKWRFQEQGLPKDLLKRGMAVEDPTSESGVKLNFEDYPYARDGLDLWCAFESWVTDFVNIYYVTDKKVQQDIELQEWWSEVRTKGHGDLKDAPGWPAMTSKANLVEILTTIIWIASALHAAVNFGQYAYTGYMPNQPTVMRRLIPEFNSKDHKQLLVNPEEFFLLSHGKIMQATNVMTVVEILSKHSLDEEYIGQRGDPKWSTNEQVLAAFKRFGERLDEAEAAMKERNKKELPNRIGPAKVPYTLLHPKSDTPGLTGMGVPNSVTI